VERVVTRLLYHGPQLDAAVERIAAGEGPPAMIEEFSLCETALMTRVAWHVADQERYLEDDESRIAMIEALLTEGRSAEPAEVRAELLRTALGGSFTYGMHVAFELMKERRSLGDSG
jgi:hypothetical protein